MVVEIHSKKASDSVGVVILLFIKLLCCCFWITFIWLLHWFCAHYHLCVVCCSTAWEPVDNPQLPVCVSNCVGTFPRSPDHPAALSPQFGSIHAGWRHWPGEEPVSTVLSPDPRKRFGQGIFHPLSFSRHSWTVTLPGLGPRRSPRWAALLTHWLIRFSSVFYTSVSPMLSSYQVLNFALKSAALLQCCWVKFFSFWYLFCVSATDGARDLQRHRPDSCGLLGEIQDCPSTGETLYTALKSNTKAYNIFNSSHDWFAKQSEF